MLLFVASLMVIQFIASMVFICPRHRTYSEEDVMSPVMVMVPCYNEVRLALIYCGSFTEQNTITVHYIYRVISIPLPAVLL